MSIATREAPNNSPAEYVTAAELAAYEFTPAEVRRCCPHAIERVALDDGPCWFRNELADLLSLDGRAQS
jgi:hypothetical protein